MLAEIYIFKSTLSKSSERVPMGCISMSKGGVDWLCCAFRSLIKAKNSRERNPRNLAPLIQQLVPFALHTALCARLGAFCMGWGGGLAEAAHLAVGFWCGVVALGFGVQWEPPAAALPER